MPETTEATTEKTKKKQEGLLSSLSGWQKVILIVFALAIFFLIWNFVFGGIKTIYEFVFFLGGFISLIGLGYIVLTAITFYLTPELFSPKKDYFTRLVNEAIDFKPDNVNDLWFRGSKDKKRVHAGHIIGLLGIPYLIGNMKIYDVDYYEKDANGKPVLKAKKGDVVTEYNLRLKKPMPVFDSVEYGEDGDTLFVVTKGWFLAKKRHYIRCHKKIHGDLNGDVEIYDINPVPYGTNFEYPYIQLQAQAARIMMQNQLEIIIATADHQTDLISQAADAGTYYNPFFRMAAKMNAEVSQER